MLKALIMLYIFLKSKEKYKNYFYYKGRKVNKVLFCCFVEAQFSAWNLFKLASYDKFGFFRPDLDGNKLCA